MTKWFEVKLTTVKIILVEVPTDTLFQSPEDEATDVALSEAPMSGVSEAECQPIPDGFVEGAKRHADMVRSIDGMDDKG